MTDAVDGDEIDICRVCRSEASQDRPLFYPCVCTGSIKYIHQDCLVQWLKYSKKEYCELCKHRFSFAPIYDPNMPKRLPIQDLVTGLLKNLFKAIRFWLHSTLVAISWLGIVPLTASRINRCLFTGSVSSLLTLPLDMLSTENIITDIFHGAFVVLCSLCAFLSLAWLREQIINAGGPEWLENVPHVPHPPRPHAPAAQPFLPQRAQIDNVLQEMQDEDEIRAAQDMVPQQNNQVPAQQQQQQQQQADNLWNPIEWDRAGEELTWDRLLGLDGSLLFLEHVFWVISLNTLFMLVFAFCPYHMGHYLITGLNMETTVEKTNFEGLITTLIGYIMFAIGLILMYAILAFTSFNRARRVVGLSYIVIKVSILVIVELCFFPLICGIWIDLCSLKIFNSNINDRLHNYHQTPGTSVVIHWLIGMFYVFYFATFVFLLREIVRPGVLWFLRNLNDPDFNPIQEMIRLPMLRHIKRFVTSVLLFGFSVILVLFLPIQFITWVVPSFFPYCVSNSSETLASELSIELLWLHVILPALLEQSHMRSWIKNGIILWTVCVAWLLGLQSYLIGEQPHTRLIQAQPPIQQQQNLFQFNIGLAHHALLVNNAPTANQSYIRPSLFKIRIFLLIGVICASLFMMSVSILIVPVSLGRWLLYLLTERTRLHELYTLFVGLYTIWLTIRLSTLVYSWIQIGMRELWTRVKQKLLIVGKSLTAMLLLFGFIPSLLGLLFQLIVIVPLTCGIDQTPVISFWQTWALGVLLTKILTACVLSGPQWWLKQAIERVCQDGLRNIDVKFITTQLFLPVAMRLGYCLAIPNVFAKSALPYLIHNSDILIKIERRIYPLALFFILFILLSLVQFKQFKGLYEKIRNEKYLVGQRLVNFDRISKSNEQVPQAQR